MNDEQRKILEFFRSRFEESGIKEHPGGWFSIRIPGGRGSRGTTIWTSRAGVEMFNEAMRKEATKQIRYGDKE